MTISRRGILQGTLITAVAPSVLSLSGCVASSDLYLHGVASGDPLSDRVILWTHITLPEKYQQHRQVDVQWQVALDSDFNQIILQGLTTASDTRDYTVKVDAIGLASNTRYFYRFIVEDIISPIGRTKTLPQDNVDQIKLAYTSCSHYSFGYFNVYARMAEQDDLDVVLHLGDYLYEYGNDDIYRNPLLINRKHVPAHEMVSLSDYRQRHALYKTDSDLQKLHATHPMICIWDDHEFANDAWIGGAENHQPETEGDWQTRAQVAIQAYYEWMPIREPISGMKEKAYRNFRFGSLMDLNILDTRFIGRDQQIESFDGSESDPNRTLLGFEQETWLEDKLSLAQQDGVTWKLLGQQVLMLQLRFLGNYISKDTWDGYRKARKRLLNYVEDNGIDNLVVLTGDVHSSWAAEISKNPYKLDKYNPITSEGALAVEFVTPAVTSPSIPIAGIQQIIGNAAKILRLENPHIKYIDFENRGFVVLNIAEHQVKADWYHVPIVGIKNNHVSKAQSFIVKKGEAKLYRS